jgi:hypothetical protein
MVHACSGIKQDPISKITNIKLTGGVASVVECLPMNHTALSSAPQYCREKKEREKGEIFEETCLI